MSHDKKKPIFSVVRLNRLGRKVEEKTKEEQAAILKKFWDDVHKATEERKANEKQALEEFMDENNKIQ